MKLNYDSLKSLKRFNPFKNKLGSVLLLAGALPVLHAQNSYTFTSAGLSGPTGPTQGQINAAYLATNLNGSVVVTAGVQNFTIPATGPYRITAIGGQGGYNGGFGARMAGDYTLTAGTVLKIMVGQAGTQLGNGTYVAGGGGGGSFVTSLANVPYVVAGGGGGAGDGYIGGAVNNTIVGISAGLTTNGYAYPFPLGGVNGGTGGNGGTCAPSLPAGSGAGIIGNGNVCSSGVAPLSFINGGTGGLGTSGGSGDGGFGGGAGGYSSGVGNRGGGGGGYSGGGGGEAVSSEPQAPGGGGGSFNSGANQTNAISTSTGSGRVIIDLLCDIKITSSGTNSLNPAICSGNSLTLTTNAVSNFTWSNGNTTNTTIVVSPGASQTYSIVGTSSLSCVSAGSISVTVNSALPVLTITNTPNSICLGKSAVLTAGGALTYTWTGGPGGVQNGQSFIPSATSGYTVTGQNGCGQSIASTTITVAPLPVTVASSSNNICSGSPAVLTATAAVTGFTWMPGTLTGSMVTVAPLANTVYTLIASDGTCSGVATLSLDTKPIPSLSVAASATNVCEGSAVTLTVTGANTYTWATPASNSNIITVNPTSATSYIVTGTNGVNCNASITQIIVTKSNPIVNVATNKNLVCEGGTATLTASGGSTSYQWINGPGTNTNVVNPMVSSTYTVTGTAANGCTTDKTILINVLTVSVSVSSSSTTICLGNSAVLNASGATTYTWVGNGNFASATVFPLITTTYVVNANTTSQGLTCPSTGSIVITVNGLPTVSVAATKTTVCKKDANVIITASGANNYVWATTQVTNTISVHPQTTTTYSVTGTDANGCEDGATIQITVNTCAGIDELKGEKTISIYPNPNNGDFTVMCESDITLKVINELGQEVSRITLNKQNAHKVSVNGLANGVYFVVGQNETETVNQKIVVNK